ncbi:Alanine--tRNA ligase [Chlamydiales bacterium STE3]|nr:Alanine--tRNA ligase [Chlamydiales bacterium STE3]
MRTQEIRRQFLNYFKENGHSILPSSPVIPHDDPTLLFTNAGMNQFKDVFLGASIRDYTRAATSQKCIRVGGKHNDLENVGHTSRHLTFFEMLGNFSFGDYFKEEAIRFAWEVSTNIFKFDPARIYPTVFREDEEAFELWTKYVPANRITRFGEKENFWEMGEVGPCGPCSELLYDKGPEYGDATRPDQDVEGERFLEFWNLVFMQYNRENAKTMFPLPKPSIDTGAGLERVMSLKMGVDNVFETDVLRSLIAQVENISGTSYLAANNTMAPAFCVIADHLRCLAFAIADGVQPSNLDRGYVLRKVLRRAVRYGRQLGIDDPFLAKVLPRLVSEMGEDYPELVKAQNRIAEILTQEEEAFLKTLKKGGNMLAQIIDTAKKRDHCILGEDAFKLKDTYGLPIDEILLLAKDAELSVDQKRYEELEQEAKERSRSAQKTVFQKASQNLFEDWVKEKGTTQFLGYKETSLKGKILGIVIEGQFSDKMQAGQEGMILLDRTPFYAEMGGQVGDTGHIRGENILFEVRDAKAPFKGLVGHIGQLKEGSLQVGDSLVAEIDEQRRLKIANNHTATHLLHYALHQVLGEHIKQAGSVVDEHRLRFDFSHHKALTPEEIVLIEGTVNHKIRENKPVEWYEIAYEEAVKRSEIKQFFGEKYDAKVRVIDIDYSKELCGGTHVSALGSIGLFRIAKESSIAAGVRRIEAVTGQEAEQMQRSTELLLNDTALLLKVQPAKLKERIEKLLEENRSIASELKEIKKGKIKELGQSLLSRVEEANGISLLTATVQASSEEIKQLLDEVMEKLKSGILLFGTKSEGRVQLFLKISDDLVKKGYDAGRLIKELALIVEGSGGGKGGQATAGGKAPEKLDFALKKLRELIGHV